MVDDRHGDDGKTATDDRDGTCRTKRQTLEVEADQLLEEVQEEALAAPAPPPPPPAGAVSDRHRMTGETSSSLRATRVDAGGDESSALGDQGDPLDLLLSGGGGPERYERVQESIAWHKLDYREAMVLIQVNGRRGRKEVISQCGLRAEQAAEMFDALVERGLVRKV